VIFVPNAAPSGLSREQVRWRRAVGAGYALLGVLWIVLGVTGARNTNYVQVGIGLVWMLSAAGWFWGIRIWRRRAERSGASKG